MSLINSSMQSDRLFEPGARARIADWIRNPRLPYAAIFAAVLLATWLIARLDQDAGIVPGQMSTRLLVTAVAIAAFVTFFVYLRRTVFDLTEVRAEQLLSFARASFANFKQAAEKSPDGAYSLEAIDKLADHLTKTVDGLSSVASHYINAEVAVSIKLFRLSTQIDSEEPVITTLMRDSKSAAVRSTPEEFRYEEDTAFEYVIKRNSSAACFACPDLPAFARLHDYKNANKYWRTQYTSKVVVPICDRHEEKLASMLGFLCVDSYAGDVTEPRLRPVVIAIANELHLTLSLLNRFIPTDGHAV